MLLIPSPKIQERGSAFARERDVHERDMPRSNQHWKSRDLENFFEKHGMAYQSECHAVQWDWKPRVDFELAKFQDSEFQRVFESTVELSLSMLLY